MLHVTALFGIVAQSAEQRVLTPKVAGSKPAGPTDGLLIQLDRCRALTPNDLGSSPRRPTFPRPTDEEWGLRIPTGWFDSSTGGCYTTFLIYSVR